MRLVKGIDEGSTILDGGSVTGPVDGRGLLVGDALRSLVEGCGDGPTDSPSLKEGRELGAVFEGSA